MSKKILSVETLVIVAFVFMVVLGGYLGNTIRKIESLEEKLSYKEPALTEAAQSSNDPGAMRSTYVPAYSHIYASGGAPNLLETTLSVRNTDHEHSLILHEVNYYDSQGRLIREYLSSPSELPPLASAQFLQKQVNSEGGSGASFIVVWSSSRENASPIIEAIMVATDGGPISFTSRGQELPFSSR